MSGTSMRRFLMAAAVLVLTIEASGRAHAAIIVTASEVGNDVIISGGGTANLTDLHLEYSTGAGAIIITGSPGNPPGQPEVVQLGSGLGNGNVDVYRTLSGPSYFGTGGTTEPTSAGDNGVFGTSLVADGSSYLIVPAGYFSGALLSSTDTYEGHSFATMGMTPGIYVWSWGAGANADSFTLIVGPTAVPEPSTLISGGIAAAALSGLAWRRRKRA